MCKITDISWFIVLYFIALQTYCIFLYKLKVCGSPALSKSIGTIFSKVVAHVVSLCPIFLSRNL